MSELVVHLPPGRPWGTPNLSPFCAKLETYLRITDTPYRAVPASFPRAPKGKVPFVELDGELIGDSQLIIEALERRRTPPLDAGLTAEQQAIGRLIRRTLEEATYFTSVYGRWQLDDGWAHTAPQIRATLPAPLRPLLPLIRRKARQALRAQGTGRHDREVVMAMGAADWDAIATVLGDRPFVLGEEPRTVDATVYGFLEGVLGFPLATPVQARVRGHANLLGYRDRVRARWWKDLPQSW